MRKKCKVNSNYLGIYSMKYLSLMYKGISHEAFLCCYKRKRCSWLTKENDLVSVHGFVVFASEIAYLSDYLLKTMMSEVSLK